jgi:carbamoyl-phosphate synthase large subunit
MATKNVLVTGIGGNVGQGIIRNIRSLPYDIRIVGCNVVKFSAGNHLCNAVYQVPYAFDQKYIESIMSIVKRENIDLILPSTDYEVYYLAKNRSVIPCKIAVSDQNTSSIYLDKYETWIHHKKYNIPFAESKKPSEYKKKFKECIVKPRKGRGSRGLCFNPESFDDFSDEEYVVQELHHGEEITTAFYVTKDNKLNGFITMSRTLENGTTNSCKVVTEYDKDIEPILIKMIKNSEIAGSANLQSIATKSGKIIPFEVNCRISGTNSIRSNFGFKDVQYTLQEFLYNETPDIPRIVPGIAVRILMDVIYTNCDDFNELDDNSARHYIF